MARAHEWNVHVLGIPASGWVAILLFGSLLTFTLLVLAGLWWREAHAARVRHRANLAVEQERTRRSVIERGRCTVCGADPHVDTPARERTP